MRRDAAGSSVMTSWCAPAWAQTSEAGEQLIDHCRSVGELFSAATGDVRAVEIVQRDELLIAAGGAATIQRHPLLLRVGQSRLSLDEAHALVEMVNSVFGMVEDPDSDS